MRRLLSGAVSVLAITASLGSAAFPQVSDPANSPLRSGDRLLVKVWLDTTFADTVRIDESGAAILPRLGAIRLTGLPSRDIADSVRRAYSQVIRTPAIEVTPLRRVVVLGEVRKPGTYFLETSSTIREAVSAAGGMTDIGRLGHVLVIRDSARLEFKDWERRQDADAVVRSGDVVWADRERWVTRNIFSIISGLGVLLSIVYSVRR